MLRLFVKAKGAWASQEGLLYFIKALCQMPADSLIHATNYPKMFNIVVATHSLFKLLLQCGDEVSAAGMSKALSELLDAVSKSRGLARRLRVPLESALGKWRAADLRPPLAPEGLHLHRLAADAALVRICWRLLALLLHLHWRAVHEPSVPGSLRDNGALISGVVNATYLPCRPPGESLPRRACGCCSHLHFVTAPSFACALPSHAPRGRRLRYWHRYAWRGEALPGGAAPAIGEAPPRGAAPCGET